MEIRERFENLKKKKSLIRTVIFVVCFDFCSENASKIRLQVKLL